MMTALFKIPKKGGMEMVKVILWSLLGLVAAYLAFLLICAMAVDPDKEYEEQSNLYRRVLNGVDRLAVWLCRIRIHVEGIEKIPTDTKKLLFVSNHRSNFDPIVTWYALKKWDPAFVSKAANFNIPIFGRMIRKCCFLAIDRENPRNAIQTIQKAAHILEKGQVSMAIYPEGTRSKSGRLLPFHNGVFKIAQKAEAQVVVLGISGTEKVHQNFPLHCTHVYLRVLDVIGGEEVTTSRTAALGEKARQQMECWLSEEKEKQWQLDM